MNNFRLLLALAGLIFINAPLNAQAQQPQRMPTQQEMAQWQKEMEAEVNKFVSTLSPEEQKSFWNDVDELTKVMETMSPEELEGFVTNVMSGDQQVGGPAAPTAPQKPIIKTKPITKPTPTIKKAPANKRQRALDVIDGTLLHLERFLRTSLRIPEIAGSLQRWNVSVATAPQDITWEQLKPKIEGLVQRLRIMKDKDPRTSDYRYLDSLANNENLINNLNKVHSALKANEPNIQAPAFGLAQVTPASRAAITLTLDSIVEAIYALQIVDDLNKMIAQYDPVAKAKLEKSEAAQKAALEAPTIKGEAAKKIGTYDVGYEPTQTSDRQYYGSSSPRRAPRTYTPPTSTSSKSTPQDAKAKPKKDEGKPPASKDEKKKDIKIERDKGVDRSVETFDKSLDEFVDLVEGSRLRTIKQHTTSAEPLDTELAINHLPRAIRLIKKADDKYRTVKKSFNRLTNVQKNVYDKEMKDSLDERKDLLNDIANQITGLIGNRAISADKRYAYLKSAQPANKELLTKIPYPQSLVDLRDAILDLTKQRTRKSSPQGSSVTTPSVSAPSIAQEPTPKKESLVKPELPTPPAKLPPGLPAYPGAEQKALEKPAPLPPGLPAYPGAPE